MWLRLRSREIGRCGLSLFAGGIYGAPDASPEIDFIREVERQYELIVV
jgi:hypothetical protein